MDTWWQTETGGILITPLPGATKLKPGSATKPFFGVQPVIVDPQTGTELEVQPKGSLYQGFMADKCVVFMETLSASSIPTLFNTRMYFTGDGARRDEDGYYWITGRLMT